MGVPCDAATIIACHIAAELTGPVHAFKIEVTIGLPHRCPLEVNGVLDSLDRIP